MMKNLRLLLLTSAAFLFLVGTGFGQVQIRQLDGFGTALMDFNIHGHGIHSNGYYDFATNTSSATEDFVYGTSAINDNDDILGLMDDGNGNMIPGIRVDGTWTAFPSSVPIGSEDVLYAISDNGVWVAGQTAWNADTDEAWGFVYNTQTQEYNVLSSSLYEYSAAYGVNNDGYAVGWVDDLEIGTLRMPAIFNPDGTITLIAEDAGEASGINNQGMVVGQFMGQAFIYDMAAQSLETFAPIDDAISITFADISENGLAVGYANYMGFSRKPIVYHPFLGSQAVLVSEALSNFGVDAENLNGTGYRISSDGNYICGFTDGPAFMASGWVVYFDDLLLVEPACVIDCPANIEVTAENGATGAVVAYNLDYECQDDAPDGLQLVLVNGLPSGSEFPMGQTVVLHQLIDGDGNIVNSCSFKVTVKDTYCSTNIMGDVEPITKVEIAEIANSSSASSTTKNEYFLDQSANLTQGESYTITVEGYTGGSYVNYVNVFFDWNQDGIFDAATESYNIGALYNSTGTDGQQVSTTIVVPATAATGITRMRVVKSYGENPAMACGDYNFGQSEDYIIIVGSGTASETDDCSKITAGNQFEGALGPLQTYIFANDFVVPAGEQLTVNQVKLTVFINPEAAISSGDIYIYNNGNAGPGSDVLYTGTGLTPTSAENVGGNFNYIAYEIVFDIAPTVLPASSTPTTYWIGAQIYPSANMGDLFWETTTNVAGNEQYIFDPDDLIWVTNTSVFEYAADGVMSVMGDCEDIDTGITEKTERAGIEIYPNPASDYITVKFRDSGVQLIKVIDITGKVVFESNSTFTTEEVRLPVNQLQNGVYVLQVVSGDQVGSSKFVVRH